MIRINGKDFETSVKPIFAKEGLNVERLIVHAGKFHADDVLCAAMLNLCCPDAEVLRVLDVDNEYMHDIKTIVADIGGGKYDHHQTDAEVRDNGDKYAACGLVFRDIKHLLFDGDIIAENNFERKYIIPVERSDNGMEDDPLSDTISAFNVPWNSNKDIDEAFADAVCFAQQLIDRDIRQAKADREAYEIVRKALNESDGTIVELPVFAPWKNILIDSTAEFVIYPSARGGYNLQTVPIIQGVKQSKKDLPERWLGNKPEGCLFVHPSRFLACFESSDYARDAARSCI